jgi:hypothetical protein
LHETDIDDAKEAANKQTLHWHWSIDTLILAALALARAGKKIARTIADQLDHESPLTRSCNPTGSPR